MSKSSLLDRIIALLCRKYPTKQHEEVWQKFEHKKLLRIRSQFGAALKSIAFFALFAFYKSDLHRAPALVGANEKLLHREAYESTYTPIAVIVVGLGVLRLLIFLIAFKYPHACRVYFYIEVLLAACSALIPQLVHLDFTDMMIMQVQSNLISFAVFYREYVPSLVCSLLLTLFNFGVRGVLYIDEEAIGIKYLFLLALLLFQTICLTGIHLAMSHISMLIVDSRVKLKGSQLLIKNVDERVLVMDSDTHKVLLENDAPIYWGSFSLDNSLQEQGSDAQRQHQQPINVVANIFAHIDQQVYKEKLSSSSQTIGYLNSIDCYNSLTEMIGQDFSNKKTFKVNLAEFGITDLEQRQGQQEKLNGFFMRIRKKKLRYQGRPAIVFTFQDVSNKIREKIRWLQEREFKQAQQQAESYKSTINHEMRTPIESMIMLAQQLLAIIKQMYRKGHASERALKLCNIIISQLYFVQTFTEDMLNLNMIQEGVFQLNEAQFDPQQALNFICDLFEPKAKSKGINIIFRTRTSLRMPQEECDMGLARYGNDQLPKGLIGDERRFKQIIINLVKNAYKFTDKNGKITIEACCRTWMHENYLVVHVKDTGVGISAQEMERLFSRFGKLHRTAQMNHEGIGLGLTIVKKIVEAHGGQIKVHSNGLGTGSLFYFCIKAQIAEDARKIPLLPENRTFIEAQQLFPDESDGSVQLSFGAKQFEEFSQRIMAASEMMLDEESKSKSVDHRQRDSISSSSCYFSNSRAPIKLEDVVVVEDEVQPMLERVDSSPANLQQQHEMEQIMLEDNNADQSIEEFAMMEKQLQDRRDAGEHAPILLVDDEPINSEVLQMLLISKDILSDNAYNGAEAVRAIEDRCKLVQEGATDMFKLIILDYSMPCMNGVETAISIRRIVAEHGFKQPFICCNSAYTGDDFVQEAIQAGMNAYISKPVKDSDLLDLLAKLF